MKSKNVIEKEITALNDKRIRNITAFGFYWLRVFWQGSIVLYFIGLMFLSRVVTVEQAGMIAFRSFVFARTLIGVGIGVITTSGIFVFALYAVNVRLKLLKT